MQLKGPLAMSLSALTLAICALSATTSAHADTIVWTSWSTATAGNPGSAVGTIGDITVTYSGQTSGLTSVPSWTPSTTFSGGSVGNAPPKAPSIQLEGGSALMETITFSSPIVDPVFAIWSLGATNSPASFNFLSKSDEPFTLQSGGPSTEYGGSSVTVSGQKVNGAEGNGVIQFDGTFTNISFVTSSFENYYAFTVGYDATLTPGPTPGPVPEPATLSLIGLGLAALPFARRSLSRLRH